MLFGNQWNRLVDVFYILVEILNGKCLVKLLMWFGSDNESGKQMGNPIPVIFNDASDGQIYGSLRVKLPTF